MKKILSLLIALLVSTSAYAGETEINRLKSSGMSAGLANEVDSIYIDTTNAQILTSPTISGNLTFSTAAAKIIPGATSLTFRNNADSRTNFTFADSGTLTVYNDIIQTGANFTFSTSVGRIIGGTTSLSLRNNANSADNLLVADNGTITIRNDITGTAGINFTGAGTMTFGSTTSTDTRLQSNNQLKWSITPTGALTQDATNGGNIILSRTGANLQGVLAGVTSVDSDINNASASKMGLLINQNRTLSDSAVFVANTANTLAGVLTFMKTRATAPATDADTIVASGDEIGVIRFMGADGAAYRNAVLIKATVDGTPGSSDMPGALDFQLSPDGSTSTASVLKLSQDKSALFTGTVRSSATADIGWSVVNAVNQACNTTCTSACVVGIDTLGTGGFLGCATATADSCICAGAS